jgi:4-amino-4-deoxy-L-arabinose transferase-like glycosyltransferase
MKSSSSHFPATASGAILLLIGAAIFLPCMVILPFSRAEAMYALIPKEMLDSGQWLTPTLNGASYLDKPPLIYWFNMVAYKIFGVSELVARLVNLLCALGEIWFTYLIGLRLLKSRAAILGGLILLTCVGFFIHHLIILTDHPVALGLIASLYFFLRWQEQPDFKWLALFYLCMAVGFLSKGFIGLIFPLMIGSLYALSLGQTRQLSFFISLRGWALLLLVAVPWLAAMEIVHPGFLKHHIVNEQILRFLGQRYPHDIYTFSIPAFWAFAGLWMLPWTVLLPEALYRFWPEVASRTGQNPKARLLLTWAAVIMGFYTLSSSRIEYYSLPALPALALILGWRIQRYLEAPKDHSLSWALVFLAFLGMATFSLLPHLEELLAANRREFIGLFLLMEPIARHALIIPPLAAVGAVVGWRYRRFAMASYGALALLILYFSFQAYNVMAVQLSDKISGTYIHRHAGPQDLVIMEFIEEFEYGASLAFYSRQNILMVKRGELPQFPYPVSPEENYLIAPDRLKELWRGPKRVFLVVDDVVRLEPYLENAPVRFALNGKRLLVNQPLKLADRQEGKSQSLLFSSPSPNRQGNKKANRPSDPKKKSTGREKSS